MTRRIATDRRNGDVVWRLAPWEVRDLCDHLEDTTTPRDALLDVPLLRAAADRLDPPTGDSPMTTTDRQMLDAIGYLQLAHPWCPTLTELATALGLSNRSSTVPRLARLRDAGLVDWRPGEPRTLHLTWEGWDASTHDGPPDTARTELELAHCRAMLQDAYDQLSQLRQPRTSGHPPDPDRTSV